LIWIHIEKKELSNAIFEMKGEIKFRKMEHEALWNYNSGDALVLGTPVMPITTNCRVLSIYL
jgi:shikimate kinase